MTTYTIAMIGDMLVATFVDGDDTMMNERISETLDQIDHGREKIHDITLKAGLTLYRTVEEAEDAGAEIVYQGCDMGWLVDEHGWAKYAAAGLVK
ncbi:MAG: hypothetical protein PF483_06000 [Halothiobacillus sp.]|jgi:hypothetical protein|nr:hypothetical protein [Halothiobacillus sp.]